MPLEIFEALSTRDAAILLTSKLLPSFSSLEETVVYNNDIHAKDFSDTVGIKYEREVRKIVQKSYRFSSNVTSSS